ncbi:putative ATP-grasp-modified RiPP [Nonomuraea sp. NPDC023979]|uniref:putative ATP-grasp-modified RiPP n=1 Tax=Nonomuraea sp. NPDC023979 TaxID=3154796 RepID=UPI0034082909
MTLTQEQCARPWGLSRMAPPSPPTSPEYATVEFDPDTQLTHFRDAAGALVDMAKSTISYSQGGGGDGSKNAPKVADDTTPDND